MSETNHISQLLLAELESELAITRRILAAVPNGHNAFKPHDKSMSLATLAGHTAELPSFTMVTLAAPDFDLGAPNAYKPNVFETNSQNLDVFNDLATKAIATLKSTSDAAFNQEWKLTYDEHVIFSGSRYSAYRSMMMNHLVHHRAQLGVYLRLLGIPVPKTYGPSADEQ